jgi:hypothetical protein
MRAQSPIATAPSAMTDRRITELHLWAVREGLRRAPAATLFEDFCRRLAAAGVPLWRALVGMRTLHPQWAGYTFTWWRDRDLVQPVRRERGEEYDQDLRVWVARAVRVSAQCRSWVINVVSSAHAARFRFSPDSGRIAASHRSATKWADARTAHGGELRQAAGAAASLAPISKA